MFKKIIYKIGVRFRNPSLKRYQEYLSQSDAYSLTELEAIQLEKVKTLLNFAYDYSSYYKGLFDSAKFSPNSVTSLEDLKRIPISNKADLVREFNRIVPEYKFNKVKTIETSGTSGVSLKFLKDETWDSANRAALFRYYDWYNVKPWDRNGYFWGYNIKKSKILKTKLEDFVQNRFRMFSYKSEDIMKFTKKLKSATFLHGYSSMIYEVAKIVNELGLKREYDLKLIKGTSEKIYPKYQDEVLKAFGQKIISEYGAGESGLIAFECPENGNMHINMQNVIIEEVDGQSVVTNLLSFSFPIIRYSLGDYIKLASREYKCPCGRNHLVLEEVLGRVGKLIHGKSNKYPSLTLYYISKNLYHQDKILLNYQAVQTETGRLLLKIEQNSPELRDKIFAEVNKYFGDDLDVEIKFNENLHTMEGKLRDFITTLD